MTTLLASLTLSLFVSAAAVNALADTGCPKTPHLERYLCTLTAQHGEREPLVQYAAFEWDGTNRNGLPMSAWNFYRIIDGKNYEVAVQPGVGGYYLALRVDVAGSAPITLNQAFERCTTRKNFETKAYGISWAEPTIDGLRISFWCDSQK